MKEGVDLHQIVPVSYLLKEKFVESMAELTEINVL